MEWTEELVVEFTLFHARRMAGANQIDSAHYVKLSLKIFIERKIIPMTVSTIEMLENGVHIGHSCIIKQKGEKPFGVLEDGKLKIFPTKKEAIKFGEAFDISKIKRDTNKKLKTINCQFAHFGSEERKCTNCSYVIWTPKDGETDKDVVEQMINSDHPLPECGVTLIR